MPRENDRFDHNRISNTALAYVTNASITESRPHWVEGSHDTLASVRGWVERRPGFPLFTSDDFGSNNVLRYFTWQKWDGAFYVMISVVDVAGTNSYVYKYKVGTDSAFVLIHTDSTSAEPFDYVESNNTVYFGNGTDMKKYDGTTVTNWGLAGPTTAPTAVTAGAGLVPAAIGHTYVYAYGVSSTGNISDISDPSTTITTPLQQWTITGDKCPDTQCDVVHIYRTEDGGATYLELSNSPIANPAGATWSMVDNDADSSLQQSSPAPLPGINAPPIGLLGFRFHVGRIWGFKNNRVYFSTLEENTTGVPEEAFGQELTNSYSFGAQVFGLGITPDFVHPFTGRGVFRIGGDSLSTFTRSRLSGNAGIENRACIAEFDDRMAWLDISQTIMMSDGYTISGDDVSLPIQPDIETIVHAQASLTVHDVNKHKWLVLCDGGEGKLRVFDLALKQWNTPWQIAGIESVGFGQTASATFKLFLGQTGQVLAMNLATYQDNAVSYTAELYTNLIPISKENPTSVAAMQYIGIERNAVELDDIGNLTDEDYTTGIYTSIIGNESDPANRTNGTDLVEKWYGANTPAAQRVSAFVKWPATLERFILYTLDIVARRMN